MTEWLDSGKTESDHRGEFARLRLFELDKIVGMVKICYSWIRFVGVGLSCLVNFINLVFYKNFRNIVKKFHL